MAHVSYWEINDISLIYSDYVMIKIFLLSSAHHSLPSTPLRLGKDDLSERLTKFCLGGEHSLTACWVCGALILC